MKHLILCREFPPAVYPPGGIGTYAAHIARALAEAGETVHVIGERWEGADKPVEHQLDGRLVIHRIAPQDATFYPSLVGGRTAALERAAMLGSGFPAQWFSWVACGLAERLVEQEGIDAIEGQEWEAPLYYFMLRRALGLGPAKRPPVLVHLHSPTEFIFRHNEWSTSRPDYLPMKRMEDFVIKGADALLCPSRYLAAQSEAHYGLAPGAINVIPLPLGDSKPLQRDPEIWSEGSICYVGRLEPRKGVIEWVDAAISVARRRSTPKFEFIGTDLPYTERHSVQDLVLHRVPAELRDRFVFHGSRPRAEVLRMLGGAKIAAVPSRWENFPNTCLEALCSGLPVLATRYGGMAEMVEHGRSGWLVEDGPAPLADRLAATLETALDATPETLSRMGSEAAQSIHRLCDNAAIARRHIEVRGAVAAAGARTSLRLPAALPWLERTASPVAATAEHPLGGIHVIVTALSGASPQPLLETLRTQTLPASRILLVSDRAHDVPRALAGITAQVTYFGRSGAAAKALALASPQVAEAGSFLFLDAGDRLEPQALAALDHVLRHCADVGMVSGWHGDPAGGRIRVLHSHCPAFPYQWIAHESDGPTLYRAEALKASGGIRVEISDGFEEWDLANAVMASGWKAARLPALIAMRPGRDAAWEVPVHRTRARRALIARFPDLIGADGAALILLADDGAAGPAAAPIDIRSASESLLDRPVRELPGLALTAIRHPRMAVGWLGWRIRERVRRRRTGGA